MCRFYSIVFQVIKEATDEEYCSILGKNSFLNVKDERSDIVKLTP